MSMRYVYGMRLRPAAPGCQPKIGLTNIRYPQPTHNLMQGKRYWSILTYDRPLTDDECRNYDLDQIEQNYYDKEE